MRSARGHDSNNSYRVVRSSLALVSRRSRRKLLLALMIQFVLALFDLIGVLLLGLVIALVSSNISGQQGPEFLARFGLSIEPGAEGQQTLLLLAVAAGTTLVIKSALSFTLTRWIFSVLAENQALVSARFAREVLAQPLETVHARQSQESAFIVINGVNAAIIGVLGSAIVIVTESVLIGILVIGVAFVNWSVMAFTVIFFSIVGLGMHYFLSRWARRLGREISETEIRSYLRIQEGIGLFRVLRTLGRLDEYLFDFSRTRVSAARAQAGIQVMNQVTKYVLEISLILGGGVLAAIQISLNGVSVAISVLALFLIAASRIAPSLLRLQTAALGLRTSSSIAQGSYQLAEELSIHSAKGNAYPSLGSQIENVIDHEPMWETALEVRGLSFTYQGASELAIQDVSLLVPAGSSLGIVGSSGAGKSTLVDLMLGLLTPTEGVVRIGGMEAARVASSMPGVLSYVPQNTVLLSGSIRENVALGVPESQVVDVRVWEVLESLDLADLLRDSREGLETLVGENGIQLSGGQRQRLGLARALYAKPRVLVMDEATSALDAATESEVAASLQLVGSGITQIIVAHRLSTVRHCDQLVYLERGRLIGRGSFEELRSQVPQFDEQLRHMGM